MKPKLEIHKPKEIEALGNALSEIDYLFQEGVYFTTEELTTIRNYAMQLLQICIEANRKA